jgi:hypothetical protein
MRGEARAWPLLFAAAGFMGCAPSPVDRFSGYARGRGDASAPGARDGGGGAATDPSSRRPQREGAGMVALPDADLEMTFDGGICGGEADPFEVVTPELVLVLDRSESMLFELGGTTISRWSEISTGLIEVMGHTSGLIRWGLKNYPTTPECAVGPSPEVEISGAVTPVIAAILNNGPVRGNGTPTAGGLNAAAAYLATRATPNPKAIVLATDGAPTCTIARGPQRAVDAAAAARAAGFPVFVVGIATANTDAHATLTAIAEAGGAASAGDPKYHAVANRNDLVAAFAAITQRVTTCTFPLSTEPPAPDDLFVFLENRRLPRDPKHVEGWDYDPARRAVQLFGDACLRVKKDRTRSLRVLFGCRPLVVR